MRIQLLSPDRPAHRPGRAGYTLVEILVVMGLMMLLAALAAAVGYSGLIGSQRVVGASDRASGWLIIARQTAVRDRAPRGVRFIGVPDPSGAVYFREAQYVEAPEAFIPNPNQESNPQGPRLVFAYDWLGPAQPTRGGNAVDSKEVYFVATNPLDLAEFYDRVTVGDTLILPEFNATYRVTTAPAAAQSNLEVGGVTIPAAQAVKITLQTQPDLAAAGVRAAPPPPTGKPTTLVTYKYAFQGQARPVLGEPVLQLTNGMAIDYRVTGQTTTLGVPLKRDASGNPEVDADGKVTFDILFSPSGQVLGNANSLICLWVRNPENVPHPRPGPTGTEDLVAYNAAGDQVLVVVSTRSGLISTQPVNPPPDVDPYRFAKDGQNNGL